MVVTKIPHFPICVASFFMFPSFLTLLLEKEFNDMELN